MAMNSSNSPSPFPSPSPCPSPSRDRRRKDKRRRARRAAGAAAGNSAFPAYLVSPCSSLPSSLSLFLPLAYLHEAATCAYIRAEAETCGYVTGPLRRDREKQLRRETAIETAAVTRRSDSHGDREPVKRFAISASKPQHIRVKYHIRVCTYHASIQRQRAMSVGRCLSACIERMCVHERLLHAHQTRCACSARITMHVLYVFLYASHVYTSYIFS
jgi:hypothetical protein